MSESVSEILERIRTLYKDGVESHGQSARRTAISDCVFLAEVAALESLDRYGREGTGPIVHAELRRLAMELAASAVESKEQGQFRGGESSPEV